MKKHYLILAIIIITLINPINTPNIQSKKTKNSNQTIYIDESNINGPWEGTKQYPYQTINQGIENSTNNDIIFINKGIYNETLKITKQITITGQDKENTIINGEYKPTIIEINKPDTKITNLTIKNSGGYSENSAIQIKSEKNTIKNCEIYHTKTGIFINGSNTNTIDNCSIHTNGEAIFLKNSNNNKITGCNIGHNSIGINLDSSKNNTIKYNYIHTNGNAILLNNTEKTQINNCNISDNAVNQGGVYIVKSKNIHINNSILNHNGIAISISSSDKIKIKNCTICKNTHIAISLRNPSKDIVISKSNICNNTRYGIYIEKNNKCTISKNNIINNYLFSLYSKDSTCKCNYNWWGNKFGPTFFDTKKKNRISFQPFNIKIYPWSKNLFEKNGASWTENPSYLPNIKNIPEQNTIIFSEKDTDKDKIPDWWEEKWGYDPEVYDDHHNLDPDLDGLNNIQECYTDKYNSNPYKKDLFLEIDWMQSPEMNINNKPTKKSLEKLVEIFEEHNITFHYDLGELEGGEEIPLCNETYSFAKLRDLYWEYFLHNNLTNPRKNIFHYTVICNFCPDLNFPFTGWNQLDGSAISAQWIKESNPLFSLEELIVGAIIHHLGHGLGLIADSHKGIDNTGCIKIFSKQWLKYRNYKSCMNYFYKYRMLSFSDGTNGQGDYNDWENIDFTYFQNTFYKS